MRAAGQGKRHTRRWWRLLSERSSVRPPASLDGRTAIRRAGAAPHRAVVGDASLAWGVRSDPVTPRAMTTMLQTAVPGTWTARRRGRAVAGDRPSSSPLTVPNLPELSSPQVPRVRPQRSTRRTERHGGPTVVTGCRRRGPPTRTPRPRGGSRRTAVLPIENRLGTAARRGPSRRSAARPAAAAPV